MPLNPISSNLISEVDTTSLISEHDDNQSTDISVVLPAVSDSATFSVVETTNMNIFFKNLHSG